MIFKVFDVSFIRLKHKHIEELRQWRNSEQIRMRMEYRDFITPEMQEHWFKEVNDISKYLYFIIHYKGRNIGVAHGKELTGLQPEGGMFFWDDEFLNTQIPVLTSIVFTDTSFYLLDNQYTYCHMLRSNPHAIQHNQKLGFKICDQQENYENQLYRLMRGDYEAKAPAIRAMLKAIYKEYDYTIQIHLEDEDKHNGVAEFITKHYQTNSVKPTPVKFGIEII